MKIARIIYLVTLLTLFLFLTDVVFRAYYKNNKGNIHMIDDVGYLYNFDDSPDYIYIDFYDDNGYAIIMNDTFELLEFSREGSFPYQDCISMKYYGGPSQYFKKNNDKFIDLISNNEYLLSKEELQIVSDYNRNVFNKYSKDNNFNSPIEIVSSLFSIELYDIKFNNRDHEPNDPPLDESNWIYPTESATYIDNVEYFLTPGEVPMFGTNNGSSCTTVAVQLLLSYNNYYYDRRIISPEYLYGCWDGIGDIFDNSSYLYPEQNPNSCSNPNTINSYVLGSNQDFHDDLYVLGISGYLSNAEISLSDFLDDIGINYIIDCDEDFSSSISSYNIINEIDYGNPVVIATGETFNGTPYLGQRPFNHAMIAYGYERLTPYTGIGNYNSYLGYIVNMGWTTLSDSIWVNSSWIYSYLTLDILHSHNYNVVTSNIIGNEIEIRCSTCGHRTLADLYTVSGGTLVCINYPVAGSLTIPASINGNTITSIGNFAFFNKTGITDITIPNTVTSIGTSSFAGCTSLESVSISNSVISIGDSAFEDCTWLEYINIPNSVTSIGDSAFEGCISLEEINIPSNVTSIGDDAFKNCSSLDDVSINREQRPLTSLGTNAFYGCSSYLEITVPQNRIADYINASNWSSYDIVPDSSSYTYYSLDNSTNLSIPLSLLSGYNQIYELRVTSQNIYNMSYTSSDIVLLKLYDDDFSLIASGAISEELDVGYYYLSVEFSSTYSNGNINVSIVKYTPHVHSYTTYLWDSYTQHRKVCSCGSTLYEGHAINAGSLGPGQQYAQCILCNGLASVGFIGPDSINQYPSTVNGSYILPNGVVVLVAADINDYLNGTLIFNYPNVNSINNNFPYLKKEEYLTK